MINKSNISRILGLSLAVAGVLLSAGILTETSAQTRDPFMKPGYARQRPAGVGGQSGRAKASAGSAMVGVPPIEQRIEYYKRLRENAAASGAPLPKVTSVLTLNEMAVTGIFQTPRGYAAMVEATPIKLSYTIYPGEKFFDGQLVAVEENRLVFRRVTKVGNGKFVSSVENKPLRQYSAREHVQGTAPMSGDQSMQTASNTAPAPAPAETKAVPVVISSPLDEMNKQPQANPDSDKEKPAKARKRPVKVAKNKKQ